ncbi:MAG TPA: flavin reductase family protein [Candidatus Polarisedimenticolia bacterium]|nr:flavin reductase family protein [Candidatus Polarisedimenticolia bacterium]
MQIDPAALSRRDGYFLMISAIVPRPIAFVTTAGAGGRTNAAPFSYFTGVSSSPPSLLICSARRRDGVKDTERNILETGEFVVNVVVEEILDAVMIGGADHPPEVSEIELAGLRTAAGARVKAPRLLDSPVNLECRLLERIDVAGSAVIAGEVVWIHVRDDVLVDSPHASVKVIDPARLRPIARLGGDLYARLGEIFERDRPGPVRRPTGG